MTNSSISAFLGLGTNLGNRLSNLKVAVKKINQITNCEVQKISSVYETPPLGPSLQSNYYNIALKILTDLSPLNLLNELKQIERNMGRPKDYVKWGPRIIDCDILFYGDFAISSDLITIPHPELHHRNFVLVPLLELENIHHPVLKTSLHDLLEQIPDRDNIHFVGNIE